jgi:hypothetical protein
VILTRGTAPTGLAAATAVSVAPSALGWLQADRPGRVLHVFERATYLINDDNGILLLASPPVGMGPFTLLLDERSRPFTDKLRVDDAVQTLQGLLWIGPLSIRVDELTLWRASPDWEAVRHHPAAWAERLPEIQRLLRRDGRRGIFAGFIGGDPFPAGTTMDDQLARQGRSAADDLLAVLGSDDEARIHRAAAGLAGLGIGFTPSGDDFLMGTMFALWATMPADVARRRCRWLSVAAADRTTCASTAWLAAAARGEASEPWHRLFGALSADRIGSVRGAARRIIETGHTSGEDALIGFVCAVESLMKGRGL